MGFISRHIFPACGNMCVCCPALRPRSRQPVKRYKKLLAEIFPKSLDGSPNDRKIVKLCEYAAKNPFRIPKIAKYLEERCHKELRLDHLKYINTVVETYNKLLSICKEQIAYFAVSLLGTVTELLDSPKHDDLQIVGCQMLTGFIYSQADATHAHNIEAFVRKVCDLACKAGVEPQTSRLRAYSLQCLSAMIWFMAENSHIFDDFDEIVYATLDNYEPGPLGENGCQEAHHNWVDEVARCEGRAGATSCDLTSSIVIIRPRPVKKDPNSLTRDELEAPKVWAHICIQRMVDLAEERTTMRRVLDPMFLYFDTKMQWVPQHGLALMILSDVSYLVEGTGNQLFILAAVVRHLDHKNVIHDLKSKTLVIQVATSLVRVIRSEGVVLSEIGYISDLCKHLRKCLQATIKSVDDEEISLNISLQTSIENCLLEVAKGIDDVQPLFDIMAIMLERLQSLEDEVVAKATIGCLLAIAHMIALSPASSKSYQGFPEALFVYLLKVMVHPNVEKRIGAHRIFVVLLTANFNVRHETASLKCDFHLEPRNWQADTASARSSICTLLEKLRKEKDCVQAAKHIGDCVDVCKEKNVIDEKKQMRTQKSSSILYKVNSIIDKAAGSTGLCVAEPYMLKLSEDQVAQLLSSFWIQANLPDNIPLSIEAMSHSFSSALISPSIKDLSDDLVVRLFQLPLSIRTIALDPECGTMSPACQRSILVLSTGMLLFAAKIFHIVDQTELIALLLPCDVDPYLGISDDLQVYVKPHADAKMYYSLVDNEEALARLTEVKQKMNDSNDTILDLIAQSLSCVTKLEAEDIIRQLSEAFTADDSYIFDAKMGHDLDHMHRTSESKESLSFDGDVPANQFEDDALSESTVSDFSRFIPKVPASPSVSQIINIRQLLDSALEVAGQVAGTTVSTSPLPFSAITSQCEALGTGNRKKLTNWLVYDNHFANSSDYLLPALPANGCPEVKNISSDDGCITGNCMAADPWLAMKLPPASPFDNFLRAAQYSNRSGRELAIFDL
uniref:ARM repeat superfamily protein n=1 Tax=Kalanchoe fedtschenkoi TaxID=63787 RepID=A0A7N0VMA9_KALFE